MHHPQAAIVVVAGVYRGQQTELKAGFLESWLRHIELIEPQLAN
jgi:hypothetical protein